MKKPSGSPRKATAKAPAAPGRSGRVHPVVIYPFRHPADHADLVALYELVGRLDADRSRYARPITVMDRKTRHAAAHLPGFEEFRRQTVAGCSDILDAWCVDTCQMWYTGLGHAYDLGSPDDIYWLIPGDFNYGTPVGQQVLSHLHDLPEIIEELDQDICIGEIATDHGNPKQLIDTHGTFALLYTWFPAEAREIRSLTERPRSEFFAIRHAFLGEALHERWYAYEQTMVMLLKGVLGRRRISRFSVGEITDLPEGRESYASAVQQVERTERVLKSLWRERNQHLRDWPEQYAQLETKSAEVRRAAVTVLRNLLA